MILPHPESNLSLNIMVLGAEILTSLKKENSFILIEHLMQQFLKADIKRTPDLFLNALTFLYTFDLIEQKSYKIRLKNKIGN